jgi:hypothetical protein
MMNKPKTEPTVIMIDESGKRVNPDPSSLTTQQLQREVASLKEILTTRLDGMEKAIQVAHENLVRVPTDTDKQIQHLKELHDSRFDERNHNAELRKQVIETRLNGMDRALELLQETTGAFPTRVDEKMSALEKVQAEKFGSIALQFMERDARVARSSADSKLAVDAALQAAKEAVAEQNKSSALAIAKSESATQKQIDQLGLNIQQGTNAQDGKINDMKERLTRIEGRSEGGKETKQDSRAVGSSVASLVSILIGVAGFAVAVIALLLRTR